MRIEKVLAACLATIAGCSTPEAPTCRASYEVVVDSAAGVAEVASVIADVGASELVLGALLPARTFKVEALGVSSPEGPVEWSTEYETVGTGSTRSRFLRVLVRATERPSIGSLELNYKVSPGVQRVEIPCGEERRFGVIDGARFALGASNLVLLPTLALKEASIHLDPPTGWLVMPNQTVRMTTASVEDLLRVGWAGWPSTDSREHGGAPARSEHVLSCSPEVPEKTRASVASVIESLGDLFGAPRGEVEVALIPPGEDYLRVQVPSTGSLVVVDAESPDIASVRYLIRGLLPGWLGIRDQVLSREQEDFLEALGEFACHRIPEELGLANTASLPGLEYTWLLQDGKLNKEVPGQSLQSRERGRKLWARLDGGLGLMQALLGEEEEKQRVLDSIEEWAAGIRHGGVREKRLLSRSATAAGRRPHVLPADAAKIREDWLLELEPLPEPTASPNERELTIAFTANTQGHLEDCGCKATTDGGIARRATVVAELRDKHPNLLLLDLGNFAPVEPKTAKLSDLVLGEFDTYLQALDLMRYDAVVVGGLEALMGIDILERSTLGRKFSTISSCVDTEGREPFAKSVVVRSGSITIGLVALWEKVDHGWLLEAQERNTAGSWFPMGSEVVREQVLKLRPEVDLLAVVGAATPRSIRAISAMEGVDLVLTGLERSRDLIDRPLGRHGSKVVACDRASSYGINVLHLRMDKGGNLCAGVLEVIRLNDAVARDPDTQELLEKFHAETAREFGGDSRPLFSWDDWSHGVYVGASACEKCHLDEYRDWFTTPHASAMQTLRRVRRSSNPECVQCHVLGLGREDGFHLARPQEQLEGVQCEACHGAGGAHVKLPSPENIRRNPTKQVCGECHDSKHSDDFDDRFSKMWSLIDHSGARR